jgi:hypothetical protein
MRIIEPKTEYEKTFKHTSKCAANLQQASAHRYSIKTKTETETNPQGVDDTDKLRVRWRALNFKVFCFIAPYLTDRQIASITDEDWPFVVQQLWAHIRMIELPITFLGKATNKLAFTSQELSEAFSKEWQQEYPRWATYDSRFKAKTADLCANHMRSVQDSVEGDLSLNEFLEKTAQLVAGSEDKLAVMSMELEADIWLDKEALKKETLDEYKRHVEETTKRVKNTLGIQLLALPRNQSLFGTLLDQTSRLLADAKLEAELETAEHFKKAIAASSGL